MTRTSFRQADLERVFRAAKAIGAVVQIDLKTLVLTVHPPGKEPASPEKGSTPFGKEDWSDIDEHVAKKKQKLWDFDL